VFVLEVFDCVALAPRGVDHREIELFFAGPERAEKVEGVVDRAVRITASPIDLVDHQDGPQSKGQRLARDEAGLRHGAFEGVHQQQNRIDHLEYALHLAAEVGVAGCVHDVDARAFPGDGGEFCQDGDAALALQVVGVHGAVGDDFTRPEAACLAQETVDQRGLAVVNVGDDRNVADITSAGCFVNFRGGTAHGRRAGIPHPGQEAAY
jgi:hypothetical protein